MVRNELGPEGPVGLVGVEAPLNMVLLPWKYPLPPSTGVGRKAIGRIIAFP
jgi:hypothetical protein